MARIVGKMQAVDAAPAGGEGSSPVDAKASFPTIEEMLASVGVNSAELQGKIALLLSRFPNGIPQQLLFDTINNAVSVNALYLKIGEVYVAAQQFALTGKGPVGHASVEVV